MGCHIVFREKGFTSQFFSSFSAKKASRNKLSSFFRRKCHKKLKWQLFFAANGLPKCFFTSFSANMSSQLVFTPFFHEKLLVQYATTACAANNAIVNYKMYLILIT